MYIEQGRFFFAISNQVELIQKIELTEKSIPAHNAESNSVFGIPYFIVFSQSNAQFLRCEKIKISKGKYIPKFFWKSSIQLLIFFYGKICIGKYISFNLFEFLEQVYIQRYLVFFKTFKHLKVAVFSIVKQKKKTKYQYLQIVLTGTRLQNVYLNQYSRKIFH